MNVTKLPARRLRPRRNAPSSRRKSFGACPTPKVVSAYVANSHTLQDREDRERDDGDRRDGEPSPGQLGRLANRRESGEPAPYPARTADSARADPTPAPATLVHARGLTKPFGDFTPLPGIHFALPPAHPSRFLPPPPPRPPP